MSPDINKEAQYRAKTETKNSSNAMVNEYVNTGFEQKMQLEDIQLIKTIENTENKPHYKRTKMRTQKIEIATQKQ